MIKQYVPVACANTVIQEWMAVVQGCTYIIDKRVDGCSLRVHIQ